MTEEVEALIDQLLASQWRGPGPIDRTIHPADEMLGYLAEIHGRDPLRGALHYFATALGIVDTYDQAIAWRFGGWEKVERMLDFASGFGRATRFLVHRLPPERLTIAEIVPEAVAFQREQFGVTALASTTRAEDFEHPGGFDAVFVTSLFTHLPEPTFRAWLARLAALRRPGGLLAFTTHDMSLLVEEHRAKAGDLYFLSTSESQVLDHEDYGTTWVQEEFVRRLIEEVAPGSVAHRIPRGLLNFQDLWLVVDANVPGLDAPAFHGTIEGMPDRVQFREDRRLVVSGWCYDPGWNDPPARATVMIDGQVVGTSEDFGPRPDVAKVLNLTGTEAFGWEVVVPYDLPPPLHSHLLYLKVQTRSGRERFLWGHNLESTLRVGAEAEVEALRARLAKTEAELKTTIGKLEHRLSAIEASRFWRARNAWFRLKQKAGLIDEIWP